MPPTTEFVTLAFKSCSGRFDVLALGGDRYQILDPSICLLMEDYSCGDIVTAVRNAENQLAVLDRVERGRFKSFDFLLPQGWQENSQTEAFFDKIKSRDGYAIGVFGGMLMVSVPQDSQYDPTDDVAKIVENLNQT